MNRIDDDTRCFIISSIASNAMKSDNPNSGIYETELSRALDVNACFPNCNQGGMMICEPFRKTTHPHNKDEAQGWERAHIADALNTTDNCETKTPVLVCSQRIPLTMKVRCGVEKDSNGNGAGKGPLIQQDLSATLGVSNDQTLFVPSDTEQEYTVRRLTPIECARLQGFPDDWCADVHHADSAEYKMWGNGMALPCSLYIMEGVLELLKGNDKKKEDKKE